jgi:sugar (pentulose or hexulose) kinase
VFLSENSDASVGAAMLAGIGTLVFKDFGDAIRKCRKRGIKLQCNKEDHKKYNSLFEVYKEIHRNLTGTCKTIHRVVKSLS